VSLLVAVFAFSFVPDASARSKRAKKAPTAKKAKKSKKSKSATPKKFFFFKQKTAEPWSSRITV
jgi:hypothetical protein